MTVTENVDRITTNPKNKVERLEVLIALLFLTCEPNGLWSKQPTTLCPRMKSDSKTLEARFLHLLITLSVDERQQRKSRQMAPTERKLALFSEHFGIDGQRGTGFWRIRNIILRD